MYAAIRTPTELITDPLKKKTNTASIPNATCMVKNAAIGMEAEAPFFGPNGDFELAPGVIVNIDVSFFGHPELHGGRIETGFVITENGCKPLSEKLFNYFMKDL